MRFLHVRSHRPSTPVERGAEAEALFDQAAGERVDRAVAAGAVDLAVFGFAIGAHREHHADRGFAPFYRVRVPASSRAEANALCNKILRAGGACVVLRS